MNKTLIRLSFRQIINASSSGSFEKDVFNDSYNEFQLQCQVYNPENKFKTLEELIANNPKANSLHYKVGFAVGLYIKELNGWIPGLQDEAGNPVPFGIHDFKIIRSEIGNKESHEVAIYYITNAFNLLKNFGEYMVLSVNDITNQEENKPVETFTLKMQDGISVIQFSELATEDSIVS